MVEDNEACNVSMRYYLLVTQKYRPAWSRILVEIHSHEGLKLVYRKRGIVSMNVNPAMLSNIETKNRTNDFMYTLNISMCSANRLFEREKWRINELLFYFFFFWLLCSTAYTNL